MESVLAIMTCFNRLDQTRKCIDSLLKQEQIKWQFVITDDGSTDGTWEYLSQRKDVIVLQGDGSLFYSGGMRVAIDRAKKICEEKEYDAILLLNDDVYFHEGAIMKMMQDIQGKEALLAGNICNTKKEFTYGAKKKKSLWRPTYVQSMPDGMFSERADLANGNCILIPYQLFRRIPNIDDIYIHSLGDYDYTLTASKIAPIYGTNYWVGICEDDHEEQTAWTNRKLSVKNRIILKESAKGNPTKQWFYYLNKNYGIFTAILFTVHDYIKIFTGR